MSPPPPDPYFYDGWDIETGSDSIKFGCIDSGVNYLHEDLKGHIWVNPGEDIDGDGVVYDVDDLNGMDDDGNGVVDDLIGYDFFTGLGGGVWPGEDGGGIDPNPSDFGGHGTHVAGIAAAMTNNDKGVTGAAGGWHGGHRSFRGAQFMCIRVGALASDGLQYVNSNNCGTGIAYAANNGAHVINCSWGSQSTSTMNIGMQAAAANGVTVVHAAGNDDSPSGDYLDTDPYTEVLSVAALGPYSDVKWSLSNYGNWIDVSAPGANILSTSSEFGVPGYLYYYGTSMAAPMVSGLALLIRSAMPSLSKDQVDSLIINTADDIDAVNPSHATWLGSGRINAHTALAALANAKFTADVTESNVPMPVQFTDLSPNSPTSWQWSFGNGDDSTVQNPLYTYTSPGVYSVSLLVDDGNALGLGEEHLKDYIWARADTCRLDSVKASAGDKVVLPVYVVSTSPIAEIVFAFSFANSIGVSLDSFSTAGLRTDYFYSIVYSAFDPGSQRYAIRMRSSHTDSSHYLTPDTGAILNLYFDVSSSASAGLVTVDTMTVDSKIPNMVSIWGDDWPVMVPGKIVVSLCNRGDVDCDGEINVGDLTYLVAYLFQGGPPPPVMETGDVDASGGTDVGDLTYLVAYLFQGGPPPPPL